MPTTSRRWLLRERTADAHSALDAMIGGFDSLAAYRVYLTGVSRFRLPLETMLSCVDWPSALRDWRPKELGAALEADCLDLHIDSAAPAVNAPVLSGDRLFGALYVLEGSTLGARVLYERAVALGLSGRYGARHLALLAGNIDSWRGFLGHLEEAEPFDLDIAAEGSAATFALAQAAFGPR